MFHSDHHERWTRASQLFEMTLPQHHPAALMLVQADIAVDPHMEDPLPWDANYQHSTARTLWGQIYFSGRLHDATP